VCLSKFVFRLMLSGEGKRDETFIYLLRDVGGG